MGKRKIFTGNAACLYKKCRPVEHFDARLGALLDDMAETMYDAEGVGLAAPQVGILRRAVVIDCGDGLVELINPKSLKLPVSRAASRAAFLSRAKEVMSYAQIMCACAHTTARETCANMKRKSCLPVPFCTKQTTWKA